jgi:aspartyl-tRNA(Asn)/glutamyl-tRNA(Gln) amidotransferase subunit B
VEQAIAYEIQRHVALIEDGEQDKIVQETRGWDEVKQSTFSQRAKESSHDYRYFPEPDLPKMHIDEIPEFAQDALQKTIGFLPWDLRNLYVGLGMQSTMSETIVADPALQRFYSAVCDKMKDNNTNKILAANYLTTDILGAMAKNDYTGKPVQELDADEFTQLILLVSDNKLSSRGAKDTIAIWLKTGGSPAEIAEKNGLMQISDVSDLTMIIKDILSKNISVVDEYRAGKSQALQFLVGQCMKATKGAANPKTLQEIITKEIESR